MTNVEMLQTTTIAIHRCLTAQTLESLYNRLLLAEAWLDALTDEAEPNRSRLRDRLTDYCTKLPTFGSAPMAPMVDVYSYDDDQALVYAKDHWALVCRGDL